jgi:hypothetical protein
MRVVGAIRSIVVHNVIDAIKIRPENVWLDIICSIPKLLNIIGTLLQYSIVLIL